MIVLYREATHSGRGLEQSAIVFPKMAFICSLSSVISTICTFKLEPNDMHTYAVSTYPINTSTVYEMHASSLTIHCTFGKFALYVFFYMLPTLQRKTVYGSVCIHITQFILGKENHLNNLIVS